MYISDLFLISGRVRNLEIVRLGADPEEIEQDHFTFTINDLPIEGYLRRTPFLEGEDVEVVVKVRGDGQYMFEAARSMKQRKLWMMTGMTRRGHQAYRILALQWIFVPLALAELWQLIVGRPGGDRWYLSFDSMAFPIYLSLLMMVVLFAVACAPAARANTDIFTTFGFENPGWVNPSKMNRQARKKLKASNPSFNEPYDFESLRF